MKRSDIHYCPRCLIPCNLRLISTFDKDKLKYGSIWVCSICGYDFWGSMLTAEETRIAIQNYEKLRNGERN